MAKQTKAATSSGADLKPWEAVAADPDLARAVWEILADDHAAHGMPPPVDPTPAAVAEYLRHWMVREASERKVSKARGQLSRTGRLRRRHRQRQPSKSPTAKQLEAVAVFGDCQCNYVQTAKRLGLSRAATKDRIGAAYKKMGLQVPKRITKPKMQALPADERGNVTVAIDRRKQYR